MAQIFLPGQGTDKVADMTYRVKEAACLIAMVGFVALVAGPAHALTPQQTAAINSGVLDAVESCTFQASAVPEQIKSLAAANISNPSEASDVAAAIITAAQAVTDSPACLFSIGEGLTKWALSFGDTSATAISIGTTIGQLGKVPVVNACVNVAGVNTKVGLACEPPTGEILKGGAPSVPSFGSSGENPNQDDSSPH
jgi:hypothetical protein